MTSEWQRLDSRLLVIGPLRALRQFLVPAVVAIFGVSTSGGMRWWWSVPIILVPLLIGLLPWLTIRYRITETRLERRSGLINKQEMTAPLDRVRSVDLESSLVHRILGVTTVSIGTGVDETRIKLEAIANTDAAALRRVLLAEREVPAVPTPLDQPGEMVPVAPDPPREPEVLATIDWSWLRFAPFSLSRLVIVAGALGALSQFADNLPFLDSEHLSSGWRWVVSFAIPLVAVALFLGALVTWLIISTGGYVIQWFGMRLTREHRSLHLTAGLFTTRSISVEESRIRGLVLDEPLLLRLVGGAELSTLATGVEGGVTQILPPAPVEVARRVGADALPGAEPIDVPLRRHGPRARRRSHLRALDLPGLLVVAAVVATFVYDLSWWATATLAVALLGLGAGLGEAAYRHLGHARTPAHLVSGNGVTTRRRTVLEADGIIGWVIVQTWFQRRAGLATLVATTAAGAESVRITDLPLAWAIELADTSTPGLLSAWLPRPTDAPPS